MEPAPLRRRDVALAGVHPRVEIAQALRDRLDPLPVGRASAYRALRAVTSPAVIAAARARAAGTSAAACSREGRQVTEVYVFAGERALGKVENIGPGTSRSLTVDLGPGRYEIARELAMTGHHAARRH